MGLPETVHVRHGLIDWSHYLVVLIGVGISGYLATERIEWSWLRLLISMGLILGGIAVARLNREKHIE